MNKESLNLIKKLSTMLLFFSIISLILTSFLPWITVETNNGDSVKYLNFEMMEKSDNYEINELSNILSLLSVLLWGAIILAFISLFGVILCLTKKGWILAIILIFAGFFIAILFIAILIYSLILFNNINDFEGVSLATFLGGGGYAYFFFPFNILSFIISLYYSISIASFAMDYFSEKKKETTKKYLERSGQRTPKKDELFLNKETPASKTLLNKKVVKPEDWNQKNEPEEEILIETEDKIGEDSDLKLKQVEKSYFEGKAINLDKKHSRQRQSKTSEKEIEVKPAPEEKKELEKTKNDEADKTKKEPKELKQNFLDQSFEKALISAIEKRKKAKNGKKTLTKSDDVNVKSKEEEEFKGGTYTVKCASCKHIFMAELKNKGDKIKCPECGKEGSVK